MKIYLTLIILSLSSINSSAQQTISGRVLDATSNDPLVGANIGYCDNFVITDEQGLFTIFMNGDDRCNLIVSYLGYEKLELTLSEFQDLDGIIKLKTSNLLLETAVVTGSKFEQSISKSTVSIEVIKPDFIQSQGQTTIEKVIDKIPGVQIIDNQANIRGGSGWSYGAGSRVMLLLDEIPILQPDAGFPNWNDLPIENIGQVEILKGAGSSLYGSAAMNGVINIKTQYAKSVPETEFELGYNQFLSPPDSIDKWWGDTTRYNYNVSFAHRQKFGKLDLVLGAYSFKEESYRQNTSNEYNRANLRLRYRFNEQLNFGFYSNVNFGNSSSYFYWEEEASYKGSALVGLSHTKKLRYNIDPFVKYTDTKGNRHSLLGRIYRMDNDNTNDQSTMARMDYGEYQFQREFENSKIVMTLGAVASNSKIEAELYGDTVFVLQNSALYAQFDKQLTDDLKINVGLRYEHNSTEFPAENFNDTIYNGKISEGLPVFRAGLNYSLGEATFLRTSWGQGYRYPTIAEQFINTRAGSLLIVPNIDLTSESGWSSEVGIKQGFKTLGFQGFIDAGLFWTEYENMMEFGAVVHNGSLAFQSSNVGGTIIKGVDLSLVGQLKRSKYELNLLLGYTYIDPKFKEYDSTGIDKLIVDPTLSTGQLNAAKSTYDGNFLKYRSKHQFKSDIELKFGNLSAGANYNFTSHMIAIDKVFSVVIVGVDSFREKHNSGFGILNLRLAYQLSRYKLSLFMNNALNVVYSSRPGLLEAPRNVAVKFNVAI